MGCFNIIIVVVGAIVTLVSMIRWFEQATEAVENGWWNKVFVLLAMPFAVWFYPSRVAAGRPMPVPHHEPVRGFGSMPKMPPEKPVAPVAPPVVAQKKKKSGIDPEQIEKLKQKMRDQGMLPPEE